VIYCYTGRATDGRRVGGTIEAASRAAAGATLYARAIYVTALDVQTSTTGRLRSASFGLRRPSRARGTFFRSFATLLGAGVALHSALAALIRQSDGDFAQTLRSIAAEIEAGTTLSGALELHPAYFSAIAIAIVRAGEVGGSLEEALSVAADLEERERSLRRRVSSALAYPAAVSLTAFGLVVFLLANTMPAFATMFASMHVALPVTTRILIAIGKALQHPLPWMLFAAAALLVTTAARRFDRSEAGWAFAVDRVRLRLPLIGTIVIKTTVARFSRTFGSLLRAGVDLAAALEASANVAPSQVYRRGLLAADAALRRGDPLIAPFEACGLFDATFLQLLRTGEASGSVDGMLLRLAAHYDADVEAILAGFTAILEPFLICALGATIGTIVASIILPLYTMIGNIQ